MKTGFSSLSSAANRPFAAFTHPDFVTAAHVDEAAAALDFSYDTADIVSVGFRGLVRLAG